MYHYALDTETTGLHHTDGDRIIEIAVVEICDHKLTGRSFHTLINPQGREIKYGSYNVHKISAEMLADAPTFGEIYPDLVEFFSPGQLVIHNKAFDLGFLAAEAKLCGVSFPFDAIDTIDLARQKWPGTQVGLDALCRRLNIPRDAASLTQLCADIRLDRAVEIHNRSERHSAIIDTLLLAQVYIAMVQTRELDLSSAHANAARPWPFRDQHLTAAPLILD
ncbi:DNA polymerase III subunit epsilon [Camelimonas fluminis]|uniref:DNA-directed DNA polymerase n=1 Tax=Camelimonas fluminis TaxID=1576911 RepID=A0ABV7UHX6_9HYPH|nr:exonuclease domain-containing protein [Camelimonas fluminis]GHE73874.1 DNA polymerase III subunit epsilon [Camelimonas fluminis]